jgi:cyclophilin family peptidyl-prolyl cis-trans isomerase
MKKNILFLLVALSAFLISCKDEKNNLPDGLYAKIETNKGIIIVKLFYDKTPVTVANYVTLAEGKNDFITNENLKNKPFYDGLKFHRVIPEFMIQGGDPLGTGSGDTGYKFKDEITEMKFDKAGVLAMANNGPATNSSQFFITHVETPWLEGKHTIFGQVVEKGMDIVNKIEQGDFIKNITIIRNGTAAKKFDAIKTFQDYYAAEALNQKNKLALQTAENAKFKAVFDKKIAYFDNLKTKAITSATGLRYVIISKGAGKKPKTGANVFIHYAGYLENGSLFDSSIENISKVYGKYDPNRSAQGGYKPIPFEYGKKDGLIPGFIEGIEQLSFGGKAVLFIPSKLGYGEAGAGEVIPPSANIIFEIELLEKMPQ